MLRDFKKYYNSLDKFKKAFWLYLVLIFVEGAMRKWFMPSLSNVWMMCREPIVIWTVLSLIGTQNLRSRVAKAFMIIGCIMMLTTLTLGHQNVWVAFYGFRIWFFHIPYIFIMSNKLNREDLIRICKFLILVFIPMTALYVMQWGAPPSSILNASMGGGVEEQGVQAAYGAVRPSGTFGHCVGSSYYNPLIVSLFCVTLFSSYYKHIFSKKHFLIFAVAVVLCLITSVSRGAVIQSILTILFIASITILLGNTKTFTKTIVGVIGLFLLFLVLSNVSIEGKSIVAPITDRFEMAAEQEGGTSGVMSSRVFEPYKFWNDKGKLLDPPFFGYGLGAGSNFGTQTLHIVNSFYSDSQAWGLGEHSSQIVTNEMGFLFGGIVFFLRIGFCMFLFFSCIKKLKQNKDILPITLWTLSITYFGTGNLNLTMTLGWIVIVMVLLLTSINTSTKQMY